MKWFGMAYKDGWVQRMGITSTLHNSRKRDPEMNFFQFYPFVLNPVYSWVHRLATQSQLFHFLQWFSELLHIASIFHYETVVRIYQVFDSVFLLLYFYSFAKGVMVMGLQILSKDTYYKIKLWKRISYSQILKRKVE